MRLLSLAHTRALALCFSAIVVADADGADSKRKIGAGSLYDTVPHMVDGGSWKTTLILVNMDTATRKYKVMFHGDDGAPKQFSFVGRGSASEFSGEIPRGGTITLETSGAGSTVNQGWAELDGLNTDYEVGIMAIFGTTGIAGRPDFEATIPAWTTIQHEGVLPFDNLNGYVTGVAVLNPSGFSTSTVPVTLYDSNGNVLKTDTITLRAGNKVAFNIPERWPETAGKRGSLHFQGNLTSWSVLGLRFHPGGAFTTINLLEP